MVGQYEPPDDRGFEITHERVKEFTFSGTTHHIYRLTPESDWFGAYLTLRDRHLDAYGAFLRLETNEEPPAIYQTMLAYDPDAFLDYAVELIRDYVEGAGLEMNWIEIVFISFS